MPPQLALLLSLGFSAALLWREIRRHPEVSTAVWIPCIWLLILGSRSVSAWLNLSTPSSADALIEGSPLDRAIFMILMAGAFVVLWRRRLSWGSIFTNNPALAIFVTYCAISVIWSDFAGVAFKRWFKSLGDPLMVLVLLTETHPAAAVGSVIRRCAFVLVPLSIVFIKFFPDLGRLYDEWSGLAFYTGVTTNKNTLGSVLMVLGLFFFCTLVTKAVPTNQSEDRDHKAASDRRTDLVIAVVFVLMIGWLFRVADSKTPLVGLFFAAALVAGLALPMVRRYFGSFAVCAIIIGVLLQLLLDVTGLVIESAGRDSTLTGRTDMWPVLLALASNPLLGAGFQSFWLGDRLIQMWALFPNFRPNQAHNGYIEMYLNLGWVGVLLFICVLVSAFRTARQRLLDSGGMAGHMRTEDLVLAKFGIGFLFAFILYNVTEAAFVSLTVPYIAFLSLSVRCPAGEPSLDTLPNLGVRGGIRAATRGDWRATPGFAVTSRVRSDKSSRSARQPENAPAAAPHSVSSPRPRWAPKAPGTGSGAYRSPFKSNNMNRARFSR
jgi:exopolysaccharide production protein ExoQ